MILHVITEIRTVECWASTATICNKIIIIVGSAAGQTLTSGTHISVKFV